MITEKTLIIRLNTNAGWCCCASNAERFIPLQTISEVRTSASNAGCCCFTIKSIELKTHQQHPQNPVDQINLSGMEEDDQRQIAKILREGCEHQTKKASN